VATQTSAVNGGVPGVPPPVGLVPQPRSRTHINNDIRIGNTILTFFIRDPPYAKLLIEHAISNDYIVLNRNIQSDIIALMEAINLKKTPYSHCLSLMNGYPQKNAHNFLCALYQLNNYGQINPGKEATCSRSYSL
jgi:hypothetical protein